MASDVLQMKIKRVAKGVEIFAQSQIIEDFMEGVSSDISEDYDIHPAWSNSLKGYRLKFKLEGVNLAANWGQPLLLSTAYPGSGEVSSKVPNLAFLRSYGLSKGVTLVISGLYTDDQINNFKSGVRDGVVKLCKNYLTPREVELTITTKEIV